MKKHFSRIKLGDEHWDLSTRREPKVDGEPVDGYCNWTDRVIAIDRDTKGMRLLETIIHELLHAACASLSEDFVTSYARDAAKVLWKLRYRPRKGGPCYHKTKRRRSKKHK